MYAGHEFVDTFIAKSGIAYHQAILEEISGGPLRLLLGIVVAIALIKIGYDYFLNQDKNVRQTLVDVTIFLVVLVLLKFSVTVTVKRWIDDAAMGTYRASAGLVLLYTPVNTVLRRLIGLAETSAVLKYETSPFASTLALSASKAAVLDDDAVRKDYIHYLENVLPDMIAETDTQAEQNLVFDYFTAPRVNEYPIRHILSRTLREPYRMAKSGELFDTTRSRKDFITALRDELYQWARTKVTLSEKVKQGLWVYFKQRILGPGLGFLDFDHFYQTAILTAAIQDLNDSLIPSASLTGPVSGSVAFLQKEWSAFWSRVNLSFLFSLFPYFSGYAHMILFVVFPFFLLFAMVPGRVSVMKYYFLGLIWVESWSLFWFMLHHVGNSLLATADFVSERPVFLCMSDLQNMNRDLMNFMGLAFPFIIVGTYYLVFNILASAFRH